MENMTTRVKSIITGEEYSNGLREYWNQVKESDGFDIENVSVSSSMSGMIRGLLPFDCRGSTIHYPYPVLVKLYAKLGLHRYNMLEGKSFELDALVKLNMLANCVSSYYMTLLAHDPVDGALQKTFQVLVDERRPNRLDLTVSIARIKDKNDQVTTKKPFIPHFHGGAVGVGIFSDELPDWPSDDDLSDGKRFYMVKESEWESTGWISLYLELVICASNRGMPNRDFLSKLEILKVAIETSVEVEDVEPLKAKSANVYIMFKGLAEAQFSLYDFEIGEHVERKAIVRRVTCKHAGDLSLEGKLCGGVLRSSMAPCNGEKTTQNSKKRNGGKPKSSNKRPRGAV